MVCLRTDSFGNWKQVFPSCSMPHFHYTLPLSLDNDEGLGLSLVQRCLLVNRRASLPACSGRFISPIPVLLSAHLAGQPFSYCHWDLPRGMGCRNQDRHTSALLCPGIWISSESRGVGGFEAQQAQLQDPAGYAMASCPMRKMSARITIHSGQWRVNECAFGVRLVPLSALHGTPFP